MNRAMLNYEMLSRVREYILSKTVVVLNIKSKQFETKKLLHYSKSIR